MLINFPGAGTWRWDHSGLLPSFFHVRPDVFATWTFLPKAPCRAAGCSHLHPICILESPAGLHATCCTFMGIDKLSSVARIRGINITLQISMLPFLICLI